MVESIGRKVLFSGDFVDFVRTRTGNPGPPNLPNPERIAQLYKLWRENNGNAQEIAGLLSESLPIILAQLDSVGLKEMEL